MLRKPWHWNWCRTMFFQNQNRIVCPHYLHPGFILFQIITNLPIFPSFLHRVNPLPRLHLARQEWKSGNHDTLGKVRMYEPNPPAAPEGSGFDPSKYPLRLVKMDVDQNPTLKGWSKIKLSIPPAARARHMEDPIYGPSWRDLLTDFDNKQIQVISDHFYVMLGTNYWSQSS